MKTKLSDSQQMIDFDLDRKDSSNKSSVQATARVVQFYSKETMQRKVITKNILMHTRSF